MNVKILCMVVGLTMLSTGLKAETFWKTSGPGVNGWCLVGSPTAINSNTSENTCYWCETGGDRGGFCTSEYAACSGGKDMVVPSGYTITDNSNGTMWRCDDDGWIGEETCYSGSGCLETCYWAPGPYTCLKCPSPDFTNDILSVIPTTGQNGVRSDITDCVIPGGPGFKDASGSFNLIGECHYSL